MTAERFAPIADEHGELRLLEPTDLPLTRAWRNHPESRRWFHTSAEISEQQHREWFDRYLERPDDYVFVFTQGGVPLAQAALYEIDHGSAEFGRVLVDPAQRGRGLAHRLIALCLVAADTVLDIERLRLEVKADNAAAIRAYEAAGFRHEPSGSATKGSVEMVRVRPG